MESSVDTTTTTTTTTTATFFNNHNTPISSASPSPTSSPPLPPLPPMVVMSPCAACKILRRKCAENCVLAPYFPPTEPHKFTTAHRVFGASNIIKFLQELPESQRADAVSSMVYEANTRIRDPVYGCAGAICQLQKQVGELQAQLARAQAELINMQTQQANLVALIYMEMASSNSQHQQFNCPPQALNSTVVDITSPHLDFSETEFGIILEDNNHFGSLSGSEPLWT